MSRLSFPALSLATALLGFAAIVSPLTAHAETKPPMVAVVDMQAVIQKATVVKDIKSQMDSRAQTYKKEMKAQEDKLNKTQQELIKQRAILKEEEFNEKRRAFEQQALNAQRDVEQRKRVLGYGFDKAMTTVLQKVRDIVSAMAKERGVNLVLARQQAVIFTDANLDWTDEVVKKLNNDMTRLKVDFSAPPATQDNTN